MQEFGIKKCKAFTLIELVVAVAVLVIAILTTAFSITNVNDMSALSRERMAAASDANRVLEAMRDTANQSIALLKTTDWSAWAALNVMNGKTGNEILLNSEAATVTFQNLTDNPVQTTVTISWTHGQRPYSYQITTLFADRR